MRTGAVALATLGCKVNQAESEDFSRSFAAAGFQLVEFDQPADAYIVNSCTVTHVADRKTRQLIRQARRANPGALIVATGCYAALSAESLTKVAPIDLLIPNHHKDRLVSTVLEALGSLDTALGSEARVPAETRTRAFVKAQDGCDSPCSFCTIPYARGRERSVPIAGVASAVGERVAGGHREIVLTGVHLGTYGGDLIPASSLRSLLLAVLDQIGDVRLRLSSIEPWSFDPSMLELWDDPRLCRHFHLALQSGSDVVLRRMRRPYTVSQFLSIAETINKCIPDAAITTDVIVGFPGETEDDFRESVEAISSAGFARVHVFPFSPRHRAPASKMPDQVPTQVKRARVAEMLSVADSAAKGFRQRFVGRELRVLYERSIAGGNGSRICEGLTDNYIRVLTKSPCDLTNLVVRTVLHGAEGDSLLGRIE